MKQQTGFTLIELIVVIVILGILAATAAPKFIDLKYDAELATARATAGAISSATAMNYGKAAVKNFANPGTNGWYAITSCGDVVKNAKDLLQDERIITANNQQNPSAYVFANATTTGAVTTCQDAGSTIDCQLTAKAGATTFKQGDEVIAKVTCTGPGITTP